MCALYYILLLYSIKSSSYWLILVLMFSHVTKWSTPIGWCYNSMNLDSGMSNKKKLGCPWLEWEHDNYYHHWNMLYSTNVQLKKCDFKTKNDWNVFYIFYFLCFSTLSCCIFAGRQETSPQSFLILVPLETTFMLTLIGWLKRLPLSYAFNICPAYM